MYEMLVHAPKARFLVRQRMGQFPLTSAIDPRTISDMSPTVSIPRTSFCRRALEFNISQVQYVYRGMMKKLSRDITILDVERSQKIKSFQLDAIPPEYMPTPAHLRMRRML